MGQVSHEEVPPPPPPGSHNSELFPELDSQVVDEDLRDTVKPVTEASTEDRGRARECKSEVDYGGQTEHEADTHEEDDDKKKAEEDEADDSDSDTKGIARLFLSIWKSLMNEEFPGVCVKLVLRKVGEGCKPFYPGPEGVRIPNDSLGTSFLEAMY